MTDSGTHHRGTDAGDPPLADPAGEPGRSPRWVWAGIAGCLAAALLLLGGAGGLLLDRREGAVVPTMDSVDVGFAQDMSVHHQNAVQMAAGARDLSTDPEVLQIAYDIESGQTAQIGQMQGWLSLWNAPASAPGGYMSWMPDMGMGNAPDGLATMPGMASQEDLARLRNSTGRARDVLFLQLMLRHHEGGTAMLRYAADKAILPQVRNLAAKMLSAQTVESQAMRQMLAARGGGPLDG